MTLKVDSHANQVSGDGRVPRESTCLSLTAGRLQYEGWGLNAEEAGCSMTLQISHLEDGGTASHTLAEISPPIVKIH